MEALVAIRTGECFASVRGEPPETCNREEGEPAAARWGVDEISHQPLTQVC